MPPLFGTAHRAGIYAPALFLGLARHVNWRVSIHRANRSQPLVVSRIGATARQFYRKRLRRFKERVQQQRSTLRPL